MQTWGRQKKIHPEMLLISSNQNTNKKQINFFAIVDGIIVNIVLYSYFFM